MSTNIRLIIDYIITFFFQLRSVGMKNLFKLNIDFIWQKLLKTLIGYVGTAF